MSNRHRTTDWRRRQAKLFKNDLVVALSEIAALQETDVAPPVEHDTTSVEFLGFPDVDISNSSDEDVEPATQCDSEEMKTSDLDETTSIFELFTMNDESVDTKLSPIHIATALFALKSRHHLSNKCIDDILSLLRLLDINVPSSYKAMCTLLRKRSSVHAKPSANTICPHCQKLSSETHQCSTCGAKYAPISPSNIPLFYTFDIFLQLKAILTTSQDFMLSTNTNTSKKTMRDVTDGNVYDKLNENQTGPFITLMMNVDGIQPNKGSDQSIWPILLVVNHMMRYSDCREIAYIFQVR